MTDRKVNLVKVEHEYDRGMPLFTEVTRSLHGGRLYAVTGPSGAGKSSILAILAGALAPTRGQVSRVGVRTMRWVLQVPVGVARRTVVDHVAYPSVVTGRPRRDAEIEARRVLADFALDGVAEQEFRTLSGGQAQRVMLAQAAVRPPDLLLVDEPTAQLDTRSAAEVNGVLNLLADVGSIVVVATHDPGTRDACTDEIRLRTDGPAG